MKKVCVAGLMILALAVNGMAATDKADKVVAKEKKADRELNLQEMTITGTVDKMEKKKKDGTPMMTWFRLIDEDCKEIKVPKGKIEEFVGCKVKVTGMGYTIEKKGKTMRAFKTITNVEKIEGPSAAAPAAAAEPAK